MKQEYKIESKTVEAFTARKGDENRIIDYNFENTDLGWIIKKRIFVASSDNVETTDLFIPQQLVEQILIIEAAKKELTN